ncbi:hypothetical protein BOTCAL_0006g00090 [Botryotinia calthae]|uniref:Uncharacterized protein n=1 Tax=Botryotinia calthae TaxID=38488 RepID=A0A4Y8DJB0_9HELO|nr:hypothetical protein BOTCAL_0006g00090 [Botryotinia calthae]
MDDEITPVGDTQRMPKLYDSVVPHLARLLLDQKLPSVDGKTVTAHEFSAAVEKATSNINSKKVFLQLQLLRPDFVQFLMDREVWETFCGTPVQIDNQNYRPFPRKDPRIDNPLPRYFSPSTLTPDDYGLINRDNLHPDCPNCTCGTISRGNPENQSLYEDGVVRMTTPTEEYADYQAEFDGFHERLEAESRRLGFQDSDERWEKECENQQAKEAERIRKEDEQKIKAGLEAMKIDEVEMVENPEESETPKTKTKTKAKTKKTKVKSGKKLRSGCSCM